MIVALKENMKIPLKKQIINKKDTNYQNGYENMTHSHAAYKKYTLTSKTHITSEKIFQANETMKPVGVAILILSKIDFKLILIKRDRERHFISITEKKNQNDIQILNIYAPSTRAHTHTFVKETFLKLK